MVALLLLQLFRWLPASLALCVCAVIAVALFIVLLKVIGTVLDWCFKFVDLFKP